MLGSGSICFVFHFLLFCCPAAPDFGGESAIVAAVPSRMHLPGAHSSNFWLCFIVFEKLKMSDHAGNVFVVPPNSCDALKVRNALIASNSKAVGLFGFVRFPPVPVFLKPGPPPIMRLREITFLRSHFLDPPPCGSCAVYSVTRTSIQLQAALPATKGLT